MKSLTIHKLLALVDYYSEFSIINESPSFEFLLNCLFTFVCSTIKQNRTCLHCTPRVSTSSPLLGMTVLSHCGVPWKARGKNKQYFPLCPLGDRQCELKASIYWLLYFKLKSDSSYNIMKMSLLGSSWFLKQAYKFPSNSTTCPHQYCRNYTIKCLTNVMYKHKPSQ